MSNINQNCMSLLHGTIVLHLYYTHTHIEELCRNSNNRLPYTVRRIDKKERKKECLEHWVDFYHDRSLSRLRNKQQNRNCINKNHQVAGVSPTGCNHHRLIKAQVNDRLIGSSLAHTFRKRIGVMDVGRVKRKNASFSLLPKLLFIQLPWYQSARPESRKMK